MENKTITRLKQGKKKKTKRLLLLERREVLIDKILEINKELHLGRKIGLIEALNNEYNINLISRGDKKMGGRISVPLCLVGKRVKLKIVKKELSK